MSWSGLTSANRRDDGHLPVEGVVVQQRGIHQAVVPVARQPVPGASQGIAAVHGRVHSHQLLVPERFRRRAKKVRIRTASPNPVPDPRAPTLGEW